MIMELNDYLQTVEYGTEDEDMWLNVLDHNKLYKNEDYSYEVVEVKVVNNPQLRSQYDLRRSHFCNLNYSEDETKSFYGFAIEMEHKINDIVINGATNRPAQYHILGNNEMGFRIWRYPDVCMKFAALRSFQNATLVIYKFMYGKKKHIIPERFRRDAMSLLPTVGYDCHVPAISATPDSTLSDNINHSQVYLYHLDPVTKQARLPTQVYPLAVVSLLQKSVVEQLEEQILDGAEPLQDKTEELQDRRIVEMRDESPKIKGLFETTDSTEFNLDDDKFSNFSVSKVMEYKLSAVIDEPLPSSFHKLIDIFQPKSLNRRFAEVNNNDPNSLHKVTNIEYEISQMKPKVKFSSLGRGYTDISHELKWVRLEPLSHYKQCDSGDEHSNTDAVGDPIAVQISEIRKQTERQMNTNVRTLSSCSSQIISPPVQNMAGGFTSPGFTSPGTKLISQSCTMSSSKTPNTFVSPNTIISPSLHCEKFSFVSPEMLSNVTPTQVQSFQNLNLTQRQPHLFTGKKVLESPAFSLSCSYSEEPFKSPPFDILHSNFSSNTANTLISPDTLPTDGFSAGAGLDIISPCFKNQYSSELPVINASDCNVILSDLLPSNIPTDSVTPTKVVVSNQIDHEVRTSICSASPSLGVKNSCVSQDFKLLSELIQAHNIPSKNCDDNTEPMNPLECMEAAEKNNAIITSLNELIIKLKNCDDRDKTFDLNEWIKQFGVVNEDLNQMLNTSSVLSDFVRIPDAKTKSAISSEQSRSAHGTHIDGKREETISVPFHDDLIVDTAASTHKNISSNEQDTNDKVKCGKNENLNKELISVNANNETDSSAVKSYNPVKYIKIRKDRKEKTTDKNKTGLDYHLKQTVESSTNKEEKRDKSEKVVDKFHGRTLLKGKEVPPRQLPMKPVYLWKPFKSNGQPEVVPIDPRPQLSKLYQCNVNVVYLPLPPFAYDECSDVESNENDSKNNPAESKHLICPTKSGLGPLQKNSDDHSVAQSEEIAGECIGAVRQTLRKQFKSQVSDASLGLHVSESPPDITCNIKVVEMQVDSSSSEEGEIKERPEQQRFITIKPISPCKKKKKKKHKLEKSKNSEKYCKKEKKEVVMSQKEQYKLLEVGYERKRKDEVARQMEHDLLEEIYENEIYGKKLEKKNSSDNELSKSKLNERRRSIERMCGKKSETDTLMHQRSKSRDLLSQKFDTEVSSTSNPADTDIEKRRHCTTTNDNIGISPVQIANFKRSPDCLDYSGSPCLSPGNRYNRFTPSDDIIVIEHIKEPEVIDLTEIDSPTPTFERLPINKSSSSHCDSNVTKATEKHDKIESPEGTFSVNIPSPVSDSSAHSTSPKRFSRFENLQCIALKNYGKTRYKEMKKSKTFKGMKKSKIYSEGKDGKESDKGKSFRSKSETNNLEVKKSQNVLQVNDANSKHTSSNSKHFECGSNRYRQNVGSHSVENRSRKSVFQNSESVIQNLVSTDNKVNYKYELSGKKTQISDRKISDFSQSTGKAKDRYSQNERIIETEKYEGNKYTSQITQEQKSVLNEGKSTEHRKSNENVRSKYRNETKCETRYREERSSNKKTKFTTGHSLMEKRRTRSPIRYTSRSPAWERWDSSRGNSPVRHRNTRIVSPAYKQSSKFVNNSSVGFTNSRSNSPVINQTYSSRSSSPVYMENSGSNFSQIDWRETSKIISVFGRLGKSEEIKKHVTPNFSWSRTCDADYNLDNSRKSAKARLGKDSFDYNNNMQVNQQRNFHGYFDIDGSGSSFDEHRKSRWDDDYRDGEIRSCIDYSDVGVFDA